MDTRDGSRDTAIVRSRGHTRRPGSDAVSSREPDFTGAVSSVGLGGFADASRSAGERITVYTAKVPRPTSATRTIAARINVHR